MTRLELVETGVHYSKSFRKILENLKKGNRQGLKGMGKSKIDSKSKERSQFCWRFLEIRSVLMKKKLFFA